MPLAIPKYDPRDIGLAVLDRDDAEAAFAKIAPYLKLPTEDVGIAGVHPQMAKHRDPAIRTLCRALSDNGCLGLRVGQDSIAQLSKICEPFLEQIKARSEGERSDFEGNIQRFSSSKVDRDFLEQLTSILEHDTQFCEVVKTATLTSSLKLDDAILHHNTAQSMPAWSFSSSDQKTDVFYHVDTAQNAIKAMIYLTDVTKDSGPFSYVQGSHLQNDRLSDFHVRRAVRRAELYLRDAVSLRHFYSLPPFLQIKHHIIPDLSLYEAEAQDLLKREVIFTSLDANAVIFNPLGVHQGGIVRTGERAALQLVFTAMPDAVTKFSNVASMLDMQAEINDWISQMGNHCDG